MEKVYLAIDLKSFYASVECVERGLDPLNTHLVVADESRTEKTICLAVTPALKSHGVSGRARLFEVVSQTALVNAARRQAAPGRTLEGSSHQESELKANPRLALRYLVAPPRMALYMEYSTRIYQIYLKYIAPEDIHVYSIDEVFIDATHYLQTYHCTPKELAMKLILEVLKETGVTATAGIGPNLYLCKVALDIGAKRIPPDENGVRIAELTELSYRQLLWTHRPMTDFWRVGPGTVRRLESHGLFTMGDVARCSVENEDLLYRLFGVNAELLIDHAWGYEPVTIAQIKAYRPQNTSVNTGQVLQSPYPAHKARLVLREMADLMVLDLVDKGLCTDQLVLTVGYDIENMKRDYHGVTVNDPYGRTIPKPAHGTVSLGRRTSSAKLILEAVTGLFDRIVDPALSIRRLNLAAGRLVPYTEEQSRPEQLSLLTDTVAEEDSLARERKQQEAVLNIRKRFGKNAILRGMNLQEGATAKERNEQIGGHKA